MLCLSLRPAVEHFNYGIDDLPQCLCCQRANFCYHELMVCGE
jgi:hypothetical protein